jgi:hypothetical protein
MDKHDVRLRLLEAVLPQATRVGLGEPDHIVKVCTVLEQYVLDFNEGEKLPDSPPKRATVRSKRATENDASGTIDPTHGGQVESADRLS